MEISGKSITSFRKAWGEPTRLATAKCSIDTAMINVMQTSQRPVSLSTDHTLRSRIRGNLHVRFWSRSGGSDPLAYGNQKNTERPTEQISCSGGRQNHCRV